MSVDRELDALGAAVEPVGEVTQQEQDAVGPSVGSQNVST